MQTAQRGRRPLWARKSDNKRERDKINAQGRVHFDKGRRSLFKKCLDHLRNKFVALVELAYLVESLLVDDVVVLRGR